MRPYATLLTLAACALAHAAAAFTPSEDGLYVVMQTTSGEIAIRMFHEETPVTVASFVGLASGTVPHYPSEGEPEFSPFYDGITFHRVIDDFIAQAGSPNGLGNDGPGYFFPDEIDPSLKHDQIGRLSMANSGANSNGSQFFITLSATNAAHLDGKHAVFGQVVSGLDVLQAIGEIPTDNQDRPTTEIVIQNVTIVREGEAAIAFDETKAATLFDPDLQEQPEAIAPEILARASLASPVAVHVERNTLSAVAISQSHDLVNWDDLSTVPPDLFGEETLTLEATANEEEQSVFYRATEYFGRSRDMNGTRITIDLDDETIPPFDFRIGEDFGGEYDFDGETAEIEDYRWYPLGERVQFIVAPAGIRFLQCYLEFTDESSGDVFVRFLESGNSPGFNRQGSFTIAP